MIHPTARIHHLAHVEEATVGARTKVWQFASVIRKARIGLECSIATCAIVDGSVIGDRCIVSHGAFIDPGMEIGNDVFIGPHVSLCNDFWPRTRKEGWFDVRSLIVGQTVVTKIEDGASIGANAVILPGMTIGKGAMVAAGSTVTKDVPAGHIHHRDGRIVPIRSEPNRMRYVRCSSAPQSSGTQTTSLNPSPAAMTKPGLSGFTEAISAI